MSHNDLPGIDTITKDEKLYALVVRASYIPTRTTFLTPDELPQQLGFVVREQGEEIPAHYHPAVERIIVGSSEVLVVLRGSAKVRIFDEGQDVIATRDINRGDTLMLVRGGHSFDITSDAVFMEVKQGPYLHDKDKRLL